MPIVIYDGAIVRRFETLEDAIDGIQDWHQDDRFPSSVRHAYSVATAAIPAPRSVDQLSGYAWRIRGVATRFTDEDVGLVLSIEIPLH